MGRQLVGTALALFLLYIFVLIARDNLSLEDRTATKSHPDVSRGGSESEG